MIQYTSQLGAGLGLVDETRILLDLWEPGMSSADLYQAALDSGMFPTITARRLRNLVMEGFAPRFLVNSGAPAAHLKMLLSSLSTTELRQLLYLFTCRAHPILADFVCHVYWPRYAGGYSVVTNADARAFLERAIENGKTMKRWSESMVANVSGYLTGCCADFGLLAGGVKSKRKILTVQISPLVSAYLALDLHVSGVGDNTLLEHEDWQLFGLAREEVLQELKLLSLRDLLIVQAGGDVVRISWKYQRMEELCDVLTQGGF